MSNKSNPSVATMGIDIGKNSFHVVGLDQRGAIVLRQKWSCGQIEARLAALPPRLIGMEACVGAHHLSGAQVPSYTALSARSSCRRLSSNAGSSAILHAREAIAQPLSGGTAIDILVRNIDEVLLAEAPSALALEVCGLGSVTVIPASSQDLISSPS